MSSSVEVSVYFDYCCPFCYLEKLDLDHLETEMDLEITWRYYQIHPEYPDEGISIPEALGDQLGHSVWASMEYHFKERSLGILKKPDKISNTVKAQTASEYARRLGLFREFQTAVFETYLLEGKGIGTEDEVLAIGEKVGLKAKVLRQAFKNIEFLRKINEDDEEARRNGVVGLPTLMVNGRLLLGAQKYEDLKYFITRWGR